jgi:hypothetical protein
MGKATPEDCQRVDAGLQEPRWVSCGAARAVERELSDQVGKQWQRCGSGCAGLRASEAAGGVGGRSGGRP